ncbi:hypothetical protein OQA88_5515 [Cercophora sp. LCS_1]
MSGRQSVAAVGERLPNLTDLGVGLPLKEAEALVSVSPSSPTELGITNESSNLRHLRSLLVNIPLTDEGVAPSWSPADAGLRKLEVRFARRWWDDRCQFGTVAYLASAERVESAEGEVAVRDGGNRKYYLAKRPELI